MFFLDFCFSVLISGMALSNEQAHAATIDSRNIMGCSCADVVAWMTTAARELLHSLVTPVDLVLQAFRDDLRSKLRLSSASRFMGWITSVAEELLHSLLTPVNLVL